MSSEIVDSKYNVGCKRPASKLSIKLKPISLFQKNANGGGSPSKKTKSMNLNESNGATKTASAPSCFKQHLQEIHRTRIKEQQEQLPVFANRDRLVELILKNKTLIILGEAGSGKTTQLPQYINSAKMLENGKIVITQPRRVAAITVAKRVAQEMAAVGFGDEYSADEMKLGDYVGYSVRFEDMTSNKTRIKFVTDGMLLREAIADSLLLDYSVIMLDEAHERTIHTDILFGIVKSAQKAREEQKLNPLKIIITSATMDVDHFANYFDNCPVVYLEGRTYPIDVHFLKSPQENYQNACISTFFQIHKQAPAHEDVLIFLTGQEEIEACAHQIRLLAKDSEVEGPPIKVCTLYAAQLSKQQLTIFTPAPAGTRKVIISTNIAETSVTISGIKYIIDSGMVKARTFHPSTGLEILKVQRISREQADQRAGRAGRESEGVCYRMYTQAEFELMNKSSIPEIQKSNLDSVCLQLLALDISMREFDFIDKPSEEATEVAFEHLTLLGAIDSVHSTNLTPLGKIMACFPLDPKYSKLIILSEKYKCVKEALEIVALISSESILLNPPSRKEQVQEVRQKFHSGYGDHITLLNMFRSFDGIGPDNFKNWCQDHFINLRNILYVREVKFQLKAICKRCNVQISSCGNNLDQIRKCLLAALYTNVARLQRGERQYVTLDKRQITYIHPSSVVHGLLPPYVIYTEVVQTSKCYLKDLTSIEGDWLSSDIVPECFKNHSLTSTDNS